MNTCPGSIQKFLLNLLSSAPAKPRRAPVRNPQRAQPMVRQHPALARSRAAEGEIYLYCTGTDSHPCFEVGCSLRGRQKQLPGPASPLRAVGAAGMGRESAQTHSRLQEEFANMIRLILPARRHFRGAREEHAHAKKAFQNLSLFWCGY